MNQRLSQWYSSFTIGPYAIGERNVKRHFIAIMQLRYLLVPIYGQNMMLETHGLQQRRYKKYRSDQKHGDIWRWVFETTATHWEKPTHLVRSHSKLETHNAAPTDHWSRLNACRWDPSAANKSNDDATHTFASTCFRLIFSWWFQRNGIDHDKSSRQVCQVGLGWKMMFETTILAMHLNAILSVFLLTWQNLRQIFGKSSCF